MPYPGNPNKLWPCKQCGEDFPKKELSYRQLCRSCGFKNIKEAARQMRAKEGPHYEKWKARISIWLKKEVG